VEADFVRSQREAGASVKELEQGWRVGRLELAVNRAQGRARVLFNREVVADWTPVRQGEQLEKLITTTDAKLKRAEIPIDLLRESLEAAYEMARRGRSAPRVSMPDFYRAFRVALVQKELKRGSPDKRLTWAECPKWAFLYNLDRYRQLGSAAGEARLTFETGSQQDQLDGLGMTLNGLSPEQEYKVCCWVIKPERRG